MNAFPVAKPIIGINTLCRGTMTTVGETLISRAAEEDSLLELTGRLWLGTFDVVGAGAFSIARGRFVNTLTVAHVVV